MRPCGFASAGRSYYKRWAGLNGFDPSNDLILSGVRIGMGCMNLVSAISRSMWSMWVYIPITLTLSYINMLNECINSETILFQKFHGYTVIIVHVY